MEPWQTPQTNLSDIPIAAQELSRRTPRSRDLQSENRALQILARQLATEPHALLKTLAAIARDLCGAGSVGVCLLAENAGSEQIYRWEALAGAWEAAEHTNTAPTLRLSGTNLDWQTPQLYLHPEQYFPDLQQLKMPIAEALVLPVQAENQPLGAIWIVSHDRDRQFDAEDLRIGLALADFAAAAVQIDRANKTKEALRESEERWQLACAGNNDGIWDRNLQTNCGTVSDRCLEILERDRQDFHHFSQYLSWVHPDDLERLQSTWQQHLQRETSHYCCEYRIRCPDGGYKWVLARGRAIWDESGNPVRAVGSLTDISDRKIAELAFAQSEERLSVAIEGSGMATWDLDVQTNRVIWSANHFKIFGCEPAPSGETTIAMWKKCVHPDDLKRVVQAVKTARETRSLYSVEYRIVRADTGEIRWLSVFGRYFYDSAGAAVRFVGVVFDATDRKKSEIALHESEQTVRRQLAEIESIYQTIPVGLAVLDTDLRFVRLNQRLAEINGLSVEAHIGRTVREIVPNLADTAESWCRRILETKEAMRNFELTGETSAQPGVVRTWLENWSPLKDAGGEIVAINVVVAEITDRKKAELDLQASNERFELATRAIDGIVFEWDFASNSVYRSEGLYSLVGVRPEDAGPTPEWWKERIDPIDLARIEAEEKPILKQERYEGEYRIRHADGRWIDVWERGCLIRNQQGEATKVVGFTTDISKRKVAEAALRDRENHLALILNSAKDYAIFTQDTGGRITSWNAGAERMLGYAEAEIVGQHGRIAFTPEDSAARKPELEMHLALTEGKGENERWHVRKDGSRYWGSGLMMPLHDENGEVQGFLKIMQDKTERRQVEEALRQSENRYRTLADAVPQLMWLNTADGRLEFCNQHWQSYTGIMPAEFPLAAPVLELFHPEDLPTVVATRTAAIQAGESYEFECRVRRFDGTYRWHLARLVPVKDSGGKVLQWVGIGIDIDDRFRAEASLAESDRRFRFLAESLPHLIWNVDSAGELRFANQKWSEYLGMSYEEAAQNNWESLVPPSDFAESLARWQECQTTGEVYQAEFRLRRASDQMERWHLSRAVPIRDAQNQIVEWIGTNTDIDDRKRAQLSEQFLSGLEIRLRQHSCPREMLWEAMKSLGEYLNVDRCIWHEIDLAAGLAIVDRDWHQPGFASIAGTYQISDFKTPEQKALCMAGQTLVISDIANCPETAPFVDKYGGLGIRAFLHVPCLQEGRWVALLVVTSQAVRHWRPDEISLLQEVVARLWTLIGHARAVQHLHESEDRFRALADNIAQLAWMTDASGWIFWYNQRWFDYTGTTREQMQGWGWQQVHDPQHVDRVVAKFRGCIERGELWEDTFPLRGKDGSYRWFLSRAVPIRDDRGNVLRWCGTNTDITDRLNAEAERERLLALEKAAREEAERANRVKDEFLAVLSHELRTPLNPIVGWAKLLRSNTLTPQKQRYALETIERNAKVQTQLIEDLLDVSRILQGKVSLNIVPVDLAGAIGSAIETVRLSAQVKSIQICTEFAPHIGRVLGDGGRLQQVVWNLLSNAVKFTEPGGKIAVKLDRADTDAQITVTDTGKGISPDFLPYVFDYFRQADSTFTRKFGGLGLGLAIVRHLVELHGGTVKADSAGEEQGATFTVRIPLMPVQPPTIPAVTAPESSFNLSGIRVLAVDDDADARDLVVFLLEDCGASVTAVASAGDALKVLTQSVPDLLLSDIGMPDTDGYMLLQQVRALPPERGGLVPAIALTAYAGEIDYQQALAAGFQRHLCKPLDPDKLLEAMLEVLADRSGENIV
ncbi:MAG: PAS domain S-box protein [Microcoleus sp. PH2017_10_PVI_O_A]|uniref:PAS domain S-box protein n=1 Tax=unclassified Microcoleus TaxID=2642155 RepID=UPI001DF145C7|nr:MULTISPECIES: PAS domain S-box protein [unclassified Microcoleus]TAE76378.1 MAG: PAS domain S-box protein [Oscillatoriales cyanobacterium]MCC3409337.1 PAS domain S-box protein [Microcoleus sp. PH2017_10_PVI_O_A]MCC3463327.1 PAS domain S-box protein [Microcoleus sp. PH2017_11_PCY_U_A]MCC3481908.1 PAS domain S-box protein [Microcoleus sp. PH2017_12_PCY_D_A]MCC3562887.1 PAS domain S-box protein [Microcoleus sp. PH2017_27_LUM_O_A]